jgi:hypothetical protein
MSGECTSEKPLGFLFDAIRVSFRVSARRGKSIVARFEANQADDGSDDQADC